MAAIQGFCMKCKEKREIQNPREVTTKNGRLMYKGTCPVCGTTVCKIASSKKKNAGE